MYFRTVELCKSLALDKDSALLPSRTQISHSYISIQIALYHEVSLSPVNIPNFTFKREINSFALFFSNKTFHKFMQWIAHLKWEISIWISQFPPINYAVLLILLNLPTPLNTVDDIYSGNVCWSKLSWCSIKSFQSALYENTSLKNVSHYEYLGSNACWMQSFIQDMHLAFDTN